MSILMKLIAALQVPWCKRHSWHTSFSPFWLDNVTPRLEKTTFCDNFHSRNSFLCLIFQATRKFLLPSSHKLNVKNKFTSTLLVSILQNILEVQFYSFLLKLPECPGTLMLSGFVLWNHCGVLTCRLSPDLGQNKLTSFEVC